MICERDLLGADGARTVLQFTRDGSGTFTAFLSATFQGIDADAPTTTTRQIAERLRMSIDR